MKKLAIMLCLAALATGCATAKKSSEAPAEYSACGPTSTYIVTVTTAKKPEAAPAQPPAAKAEVKPEATPAA